MSYYENRIKELEHRIEQMARANRLKAIPVESQLVDRIVELNKENAHLKAELQRCFEMAEAIKNERKSAVFKEGVWYVPVVELKSKEADCMALKAEVERLRKAGDAMQKRLIFLHDRWDSDEPNVESDAWNAAKEGKPSI